MSTFKKMPIIGIMGPGTNATRQEIKYAEELGGLIAKQGWRILTGGVNTGVMHAALKGAKLQDPNCVTIGILPHHGEPEKTSEYADICIPTGMGEGRNYLNVLTSDFIVSCCDNIGSSPGTMSEAVFAIKHKKPFIGLHWSGHCRIFYFNFLNLFENEYRYEKQKIVNKPEDVILTITEWLEKK